MIELRTRLRLQSETTHVANNADNSSPVLVIQYPFDAFANGVPCGKKLPDQRLVNYSDERLARAVRPIEVAPAHKAHSHGFKITGGDRAVFRHRLFAARRLLTPFDSNGIHTFITTQGQVGDGPDRAHSRQAAQSRARLLDELRSLSSVRVARPRQRYLEGGDAIRPEARINRQQPLKTLQHQDSADQQDSGQRHFSGHKHAMATDAAPGRVRATGILERLGKVYLRGLPGGDQTEQHAG